MDLVVGSLTMMVAVNEQGKEGIFNMRHGFAW